MNEERFDQQEKEWSERFDLGFRSGRDEQEKEAFRAYALIHEQLESAPVPSVDRQVLARRLASEMASRAGRIAFRRAVERFVFRPAFAAMCFAVLVVSTFVYLAVVSGPVTQIEFLTESGSHIGGPSWYWERRLQWGGRVDVPDGVIANLKLADSSILTCSPEARIAVNVAETRDVELQSGGVTVEASHVDNSTFTVHTPVVDVAVLGTVFDVDVSSTPPTTAKINVKAGKVLLIKGDESKTLAAGRRAVVDGKQIAIIEPETAPKARQTAAIAVASPPAEPTPVVASSKETPKPADETWTSVPDETWIVAPKVKLDGKVVDAETGAPIANAKANVRLFSLTLGVPSVKKEVRTANDGSFELEGYAQDEIRRIHGHFGVNAEGYVSYRCSVRVNRTGWIIPSDRVHDFSSDLTPDDETPQGQVTIGLNPARSAIIRVVDSSQSPVFCANVFINVRHRQEGKTLYLNRTGETNEKGECRFDDLADGLACARAIADSLGEAFSEEFETGRSENPAVVEVVLLPASSVSGQVNDSQGKPVEGAYVTALNMQILTWPSDAMLNTIPSLRLAAVTDENGNYRITGLGEGAYTITVHERRSEIGPASFSYLGWEDVPPERVDVKPGENITDVDFVVGGDIKAPRNAEIRGKVVNEAGESIPNAEVLVDVYEEKGGVHVGILGSSARVRTNDEGEFHATDLPSGERFSLHVSASGYAYSSGTYEMNGEYVTVTLKPSGSVRGVVLNSETGLPVGQVNVTLIQGTSYDGKTITTSDDGIFLFEDVQPGTYRLMAEGDGFARTYSEPIEIQGGELTDGIQVRIEPGMSFEGILMDSERNPVSGAIIKVQSKLEGIETTGRIHWGKNVQAVSGADGSFELEGLSPSGDALYICHNDFVRLKFIISPDMYGNGATEIVLEKGGAIEGTVVDSDGSPISGAVMDARGLTDPEGLHLEYKTTTDKDGVYRFENLPPMRFRITAKGMRRIVTVKEGETVCADFGTGDGALVHGTVYREGRPVSNAFVQLELYKPQVSRSSQFTTFTDGNGHYIFKGIPEGEAVITYISKSASSYTRRQSIPPETTRRVTVTDDQKEYEIDLYPTARTIEGVVKDAASGEPIPDVDIRIVQRDFYPYGAPKIGTVYTNADGTFSLRLTEPVEHELIARHEKYADQIFRVDPSTDADSPVQVLLQNTETAIEAHVSYNGQPIVSDQLSFRVATDTVWQRVSYEPVGEEPGVYRVTGFNPGNVEIRARIDNTNRRLTHYSQSLHVEPGATAVVFLSIQEMTWYEILLETNDGGVIDGPVTVEIPDYPEAHLLHRSPLAQNNIVTLSLPTGRHLVRLKAPGYYPVEFIPADRAENRLGHHDFLTVEPMKE